MPNLGSVQIDQRLGFLSICWKLLLCLEDICERDVQVWPWGGTNWRGSWDGLGMSMIIHDFHFLFLPEKQSISILTYIANHAVLKRLVGRLIEFRAACCADEEVLIACVTHGLSSQYINTEMIWISENW